MDHGIIDIVLQGLVGPLPLTLATVATYGLLLKSVRTQTNSLDSADTIFYAAVGLLTIPVLGALVFLWSFALDLSFAWGTFVWCGALAIAHHCANFWANFVTARRDARADLAEPQRAAA